MNEQHQTRLKELLDQIQTQTQQQTTLEASLQTLSDEMTPLPQTIAQLVQETRDSVESNRVLCKLALTSLDSSLQKLKAREQQDTQRTEMLLAALEQAATAMASLVEESRQTILRISQTTDRAATTLENSSQMVQQQLAEQTRLAQQMADTNGDLTWQTWGKLLCAMMVSAVFASGLGSYWTWRRSEISRALMEQAMLYQKLEHRIYLLPAERRKAIFDEINGAEKSSPQ